MIARLVLILMLLAGPVAACEVPSNLAALRTDLLALVNARRTEAGLPVVHNDARLGRVAQDQACRMADRARLTHRAAGSPGWDVVCGARIIPMPWRSRTSARDSAMRARSSPAGWIRASIG